MYGLLQTDIIAHTALKEYLRPFGYEPAPITPGFFFHNKNRITFRPVVEDFGIIYQRRADAIHLLNPLQENMK